MPYQAEQLIKYVDFMDNYNDVVTINKSITAFIIMSFERCIVDLAHKVWHCCKGEKYADGEATRKINEQIITKQLWSGRLTRCSLLFLYNAHPVNFP